MYKVKQERHLPLYGVILFPTAHLRLREKKITLYRVKFAVRV